ncbi:tRNA(Ile)-lysidine synthase [Bacteroides pyogenes]|uniref:tRNA lysidine(34) synthetase TilS n=1 Tax=Bacteroides pyogenes TaxID=310300 RepID=UPI001BADC6FA|nr:tRNA lysidine(34) synthetase TilS [Bacteroides pyogenes]MBR8709574.1 tRNA(Ile)-lysidine synthase [Bacteroides pyogenes]MBR8718425.1 tRNA(Ile)-lysidine synthase [Bacteroides pyogenes]MBR8719717.1 tRNA(Ile)-lysidine synthase [Bacteroides pyogenes]MBR8726097.1 tRNA(Ile)-lysidine synthase [Bacteroides pyogenes]MBR8739377.1 tRNA(Ile)-lysidine synthase [Bacteroides pyogenes]
MIKKRVKQYIEKEKLFSPESKVFVALSGGADSVALLRLLHSIGYRCEAAHCNFHLRGTESDRDERFVRGLCRELSIPLHTTHFETTGYAAEKHVSIEMAARDLRYEWFEKLRVEYRADAIAVAHHQDDSVETMLLNLIRGTGIKGLLGIRPRNGSIVRPLLCATREEIIRYLRHIKQEYVTDSTNTEDEYTRNKIRLHLLPLMEEINPSVKKNLTETGSYLNEAYAIYHKGIADAKERVMTPEGIRIDKLLEEPAPRSILFEILHPLGFNPSQINDITSALQSQPGKIFTNEKWRVIKDRSLLLIDPLQSEEEEEENPPFRLISEEKSYTPDFQIPRGKEYACFDADKLNAPLHCRKWQKGDVFVPFGMKGKKKVSDYLTDHKFSIKQKEQQWVLCCGEHIAWLIGERTDDRFRIDEHTRRVVVYRTT